MKRIVAGLLLLFLMVLPRIAYAGVPTYTGSVNVPVAGQLKLLAGGTGCVIGTLGVMTVGNCPTGTAAILAGTNITITGSNPYTINCPLCFQTTGGTVSGATTFSSSVTFNGTTAFAALPSSSVGFTNSSTSVPVISGASGAYSAGYKLGNGSGTFSQMSTSASSLCSGTVAGSGWALTVGSTLTTTIDNAGNLCTIGTIYYTSARADKFDIHAAGIDGLGALRGADFDLAWRYLSKYGDPHEVRIGPMADDLPAYISGEHHNRIDLEALVVTEGVAIKQLDAQVRNLYIVMGGLASWCVLLSCGVLLVLRERR